MSDAKVICQYAALSPQPNQGTLTLTNCNPSISNDETLSSWDVIIIVAFLVVLGLVGQYIMHHINRKALTQVWQNTTPSA